MFLAIILVELGFCWTKKPFVESIWKWNINPVEMRKGDGGRFCYHVDSRQHIVGNIFTFPGLCPAVLYIYCTAILRTVIWLEENLNSDFPCNPLNEISASFFPADIPKSCVRWWNILRAANRNIEQFIFSSQSHIFGNLVKLCADLQIRQ